MRSISIVFMVIPFFAFNQNTINQELQGRIYKMYQMDQECRGQLRSYLNHELDTNEYKRTTIERRILEVDSINSAEIRRITETIGFPGYDRVDTNYSDAFWNLVQHQDKQVELQREVLEKMKIEVDRKNASFLYYAYLIDRVNINTGEKQVYGTQMQLNSDSTSYEPKPVIEPEQLNRRRKEAGLIPIEAYIKMMNDRYRGTLKEEE